MESDVSRSYDRSGGLAIDCHRVDDRVRRLNHQHNISERKRAETQAHRDELNALVLLSGALRVAPTRAEMLPVILDQVMNLLEAEAAALILRDPAANDLVIELGRGLAAIHTGRHLPPDDRLRETVVNWGWPYLTNELSGEPRLAYLRLHDLGLKALVGVPLLARGQPIGALWAARRTRVGEAEVSLMTAIGDMAGNALQRAELHEQLAARAVSLEQQVRERTAQLEEAKAELLQVKLEAERANRARNEFLSQMSHELRTPLTSVLGFTQLLEMDSLGVEADWNVQQILKAGRHLLTLINEVLDLARVESGRLSVALEPVPVGAFLREVLNLVGPLAAQRDVTLEVEEKHEAWFVRADQLRFTQVLLNLLSNAIKYNYEGGTVVVGCELRKMAAGLEQSRPSARQSARRNPPGKVDGPKQPVLRFTVRDTGPGIPSEKLTRLFTPFDRLDVDTTGIPGTGLGLALSQKLVEAMEGAIGVESTEGRGSTFWVELPLAEVPQDAFAVGRSDSA